ncbi:hypothetical protein C8R44DRAFT_758176 [Mycena epipterygia]|nr:hypothetical protein C8R44DRAFT_758176 [Mycena epipterygia]
MDELPNELLDRICSFLERRELWAIVQVSSRFRSIAILPFLSRCGITQSDIRSGTLAVSDSVSLILVVARITPIQKLVCFEEPTYQLSPYPVILSSILSSVEPIPDIVIYNRQYTPHRGGRETAYFLAHIPPAATNTLLIVDVHSGRMCMSRPRSTPPIRWVLPPPLLWSTTQKMSTPLKILVAVFAVPLSIALYFASAYINLRVVLGWAYRLLVGSGWPQEDRIIEDAGLLDFGYWMRIRTLPGQLTLVTLTTNGGGTLTFEPLPGFTDEIYKSLLASLELGMNLSQLTIEAETNLPHIELMAFIQRHPYLRRLAVEPNSIRSSSLTTMPIPRTSESKIEALTARASYIPYLLPAAPNVSRIRIPFRDLPSSIPKRPPTPDFDLPAYRLALEAIAKLPGTHPLALTLTFPLTSASLPWLALSSPLPADNVRSADSVSETRLPRVTELALLTGDLVRFRPSDIRAMARWLALFPGLERVSFAHGAVEQIPAAEREVLAEIVCAACSGIRRPEDVSLNILDD